MRVDATFELDNTADFDCPSAEEVIKDEFLKALRETIRKKVKAIVAAREGDLTRQVEAAGDMILNQLRGMTLEEARAFVKGIYGK